MNFKHSAIFYTSVYVIVALGLYLTQHIIVINTYPVVSGLPVLYAITLLLNYYLHQSIQSRPAMMVNAIMLSSMGRFIGFGGVIAFTAYVCRDILILVITVYSLLYLVSLGGDLFFVKQYKVGN